MKFERNEWTLDWIDIGEGLSGEYDPNDPEDIPLLRADLYLNGELVDSGSYCTMCRVGAHEKVLRHFSDVLFDQIEQDGGFHKHTMEMWTWETEWPKRGRL